MNNEHRLTPSEIAEYHEALCDAIEALYRLKKSKGLFFYGEALALMEHQVDAEAARLRETIDAKT